MRCGRWVLAMTTLICPHCEKSFDLRDAVRETEHRELTEIAAKFGRAWSLAFEYSECFRQSEFGNVPLTKRLRILKELSELFDTSLFSYQKKRYRTDWNTILRCLKEICNMQKWGFRNHNYLKTMLKKDADQLSIQGLSAKEERIREWNLQSGVRDEKPLDDRVKKLAEAVGKEVES